MADEEIYGRDTRREGMPDWTAEMENTLVSNLEGAVNDMLGKTLTKEAVEDMSKRIFHILHSALDGYERDLVLEILDRVLEHPLLKRGMLNG